MDGCMHVWTDGRKRLGPTYYKILTLLKMNRFRSPLTSWLIYAHVCLPSVSLFLFVKVECNIENIDEVTVYRTNY